MLSAHAPTQSSRDIFPAFERHILVAFDAARRQVETSATAQSIVAEVTPRVVNDYAEVINWLKISGTESGDTEDNQSFPAAGGQGCPYSEILRHPLPAPEAETATDLGEHLEQVCSAVALGPLLGRNIHLALIRSDALLSSRRCWRMGLIVAELISNASRYAVKPCGCPGGRILVEVYQNATHTCCRISDDGGFEASLSFGGRKNVIVEAIARELNGCVQWSVGVPRTVVELIVPTYG